MDNDNKKVAIYARVSSDKQDVDLSISAQLKAIREYAKNNGYEVVREFIDEAETGRTTARPAFREMISLSRHPQKPFDSILVWKYSRFARSREDSIVYKAMLRKSGVSVISINEPFDDTPTGRLLEAIIESLDEFYSDNLGEEVTRGMRESAARGFYLSSRPPYGYRKIRFKDGEKERTKLEIEPNQAGIVSSMFNDALKGKGLTEIAKDLNNKGIASPRGKGWGKTAIRTIMSNEAYAGTFVWGRNSKRGLEPVRVENACPVIVSRQVFDSAQELIRERAPKITHPKRTGSRFLLSGFTFCGHCGKAMIGQDAKSGKFSYYVCGTLNKKGAGSCPSHYFNSRVFEETVVKVIRENILTEDHLKRLVEMVNQEMDVNSREYQNELDAVLEEMADTNRRLERLYDAVESGKIPLADLAPRIRDLRLRNEKLQERKIQITTQLSDRKVELASPEIVKSYVKDMRKILEESELTGKRAFLRGFIKKIDVINHQGVIHYLLPINGVLEERIGVLPIVQYGGQ
ncbi:serine recombinase [Dehalococcoides mccartyi]|uniref:recombinase family protein n=1 Tax=Dehalococcoides mccartyi TaxID=61435 RepID=UPI00098EC630|nr:recombinase family protein [Dehalococcoides mccartyi]AQU05286.1 serine recombinase [Dehalococcoides mccartyi]AQU06739.1 serine recombinase [Dehalococcoides mccartyi]